MSKTKKSKHKRSHRIPVYRRPWVIVLFFLSLIAAVVWALLFVKPRTTQPDTAPVVDTATSNTTTAQSDDNAPTTEETPPEPENKVTQYEGEDPNQASELTGVVTYSDVFDGMLNIGVAIDQYLVDGGTCTLILTGQTGNRYEATTPAFADVTTSACHTFRVPLSELASGNYDLEVHVSSGGKNGIIKKEIKL